MVTRALLLILTTLSLSSCSVFMAASASKTPELGVLRRGAHIKDVNKALGKPISFLRTGSADIATYQYFTGDEANYGRAATYAVLDAVTAGLAEFITFPTESLQGDKHTLTVRYTRGGFLESYESSTKKAPLPVPEKLIEEHLPKAG